ncbi:MAG: hypothetical protein D6808_00390, partial [Candidatus Dadabacteria bacterium]
MSFKPSDLIERALCAAKERGKPFRVLLTEGDDKRVVSAANEIVRLGFGEVVILTKKDCGEIRSGVTPINWLESDLMEGFVSAYLDRNKGKGITEKAAKSAVSERLYFGGCFLQAGLADVAVSGACTPTAEVFRAGIRCIGPEPGVGSVSSMFLMLLKDGRALT